MPILIFHRLRHICRCIGLDRNTTGSTVTNINHTSKLQCERIQLQQECLKSPQEIGPKDERNKQRKEDSRCTMNERNKVGILVVWIMIKERPRHLCPYLWRTKVQPALWLHPFKCHGLLISTLTFRFRLGPLGRCKGNEEFREWRANVNVGEGSVVAESGE